MTLAPHLPMRPGESATGYAVRLTLFHTGEQSTRILSDHGIDPRRFASGEADSIAQFCCLSGTRPDAIEDRVISRHRRHRTYRGERYARTFVRPDGARFCPNCLLEDGPRRQDRYARLDWRFDPVRICRRHGKVLAAGSEVTWVDYGVPFPCSADLEQLVERSPSIDPTRFDDWMAGRIAGTPIDEGPFLQGQTLEQGARLSLMLGATLEHGLRVKVADLSEPQRAEATARGFEIAVAGDEAIMSSLDEIRALSLSTAGQAKFRAMYGNFYEWLRSTGGDTDPGPIRDRLREHILRTTALAPGDLVLGERVEERRLHSAYSLSVATGLHPKRLRKILLRLGLAPPGCEDLDYNRLVFPVGETEALCDALATALSLTALPAHLGCTRTQAESLYHEGMLQPMVTPGGGLGTLAFSLDELERFLDWIAGFPEAEYGDGVGVTRAAKMTSISTAALFRRMIDGQIQPCRLKGPPSVAAVMIPIRNIKTIQIETLGSTAAA